MNNTKESASLGFCGKKVTRTCHIVTLYVQLSLLLELMFLRFMKLVRYRKERFS